MKMIKLTIPGEPCAKQRPRLGKGYTYTPQKTVNYETLIKQLYIMEHRGKRLDGPLKLTVGAFFSIPKSTSRAKREKMLQGITRPTKRPDWDNVGKVISDALNGLAYHDDSQIVSATVEKWYSTEPRVEVEIIDATKIEN
jgi:Holliday junction resolvase RusA-like endonuclease